MNDNQLSELVALVDGPNTAEAASRVLEILEQIVDGPDDVGKFVERFAGMTNNVVVGPLLFLLARWSSRRTFGAIGKYVLRAVELLRLDDDTAHSNLITAIELSSMHDDLLEAEASPPPALVRFLLTCASRSDNVRQTLVKAICGLYADGVLQRAAVDDVRLLRARLAALDPDPDSFLARRIARGYLDDFLADPKYQ